MTPTPRSITAVVLLLLASSLAACSEQAPDPAPAAAALAQGLVEAELSAVPVVGGDGAGATDALELAYGPLTDVPRTVTVESVAIDGRPDDDGPATATATLRSVWDVDDSEEDWSYTTEATLEYNTEAEAWETRFAPDVAVKGLRDGETLRLRTATAERGDILGADDDVLVTNRPVLRLGIDKSRLDGGSAAASAQALAGLVDIDAQDFAQRVEAAGDRAFVEGIVLRDDDSLAITEADVAEIPGGRAIPDELPLAPSRTFARAILGTVGPASAELVEKSEGRLSAGDAAGLSGIQSTYDERLAGTPGLSVWTAPAPSGDSGGDTNAEPNAAEGADAAGEPRQLFSRPAVDGEAIKTTLDPSLQSVAEDIVSAPDSPSGIVALRPSDGSVLAAASGPQSNSYNTAMIGRYAPGSTFKVVSALAMLRSGYTPQSKVECPQTTVLDGRSFKNYTGYPEAGLGTITLSEAIAQSCNTVFIQASDKVDMATVAEAAGSLGLAEEPSAGAPAFLGSVPADSTGTTHAANMIGQGVVETSVLGMATVAASVANGATVSPRIVEDPAPAAARQPSAPLTEDEAAQLLDMMGGTVDHGTVTELQDVPGPAVAAKTGTAEYGDGTEDLRHTWVIAVQGDLAVAAFVETGTSGAETGGPLIKEFLTRAHVLAAADG